MGNGSNESERAYVLSPGKYAANPSVAGKVLTDQVGLLYKQLPLALAATFIVGLFVGYCLWNDVPPAWLTVWLTTLTLLTAARVLLLHRYKQRNTQSADARYWGQCFVVGTFLSGILWGALGYLYPENSYIHQAFVAFILAGLAGGALSSTSSYPLAYRSFLLCSMLPYAFRLYSEGGRVSATMSVMVLVFIVMMWLISLRHYHSITAALKLRYDNQSLMKDLQITKKHEAILNEELEGEISERKRTEAALQSSTEVYRALVETTGIGYHILDDKGRILNANPAYVMLTGHQRLDEIRGHHVAEWTAPYDKQRNLREVEQCLSIGSVRNLEIDYLHADGNIVPVEINATVLRDRSGVRILALSRDITERKKAEIALRKAHSFLEQKVEERTVALAQEKEIFRVTLASIGDAVITTDATAQITYLNRIAEQLTGWRNEEAYGLNLADVFSSIDDADSEQTSDIITHCIEQGQTIGPGHHCHLVRRDGSILSIDTSVAPILNSDNNILGAVLTFRDVTEQRELAQQLTHQATHDRLTGLVNRYEFEQRLENLVASAQPSSPHALLYLDLDQFKVVNDTCGHTAGDDLLRQLATILQSKLRSRDTLARLGGDEFGVILEHCPVAEATRIANLLRDLVHAFRFSWQGKTFSLGVSIGLVSIANHAGNPSHLLSSADSACFAAKDKGRNRVHVYQADDITLAQRDGQMRWLPRIQNAINEDRLRLYCQRVVTAPFEEGVASYGEILLRMVDEQGNIVPPGAFLPAAERYDQMLAIDRWVVTHSLATIQLASRAQPDFVYAINVSGQSIGEERFLDFVVEELSASNVNPNQLCFEITETAAISDLSHVLRFVNKLKNYGCRFALDDFGAGLSSFSYLKTLPVDYLKIDGGFVRDMATNPTDYAMVEAIHRIGHVMGLKTIAEWVESDTTLRTLQTIGVDYAQGFSVGTPRPLLFPI